MARPKQYADASQKQAAYRKRLNDTYIMVDRHALDLLHSRLDALQNAIRAAAKAGDAVAMQCAAASPDTILDNLTHHFTERSLSTKGTNTTNNEAQAQTRKPK